MKKKKKERFKFVVAIDLGTFGTGVAFSSTSNQRIHSISFSSLSQQRKTTTSIFIRKNNGEKSVFFGDEARTMYMSCPNDIVDGIYFFQRFKMCLFNERKTLVESANGNTMDIVDIFTEALIFFRDNIPKIITRTTKNGSTLNNTTSNRKKKKKKFKSGKDIKATDIRWVFTIPAILSNHAKGVIRVATERAGLGNISDLVLEPECASVFLEESYVRKYERMMTRKNGTTNHTTKKKKSKKKQQRQLSTYMVVDCGGGTVDITLQQVLPDKTLKNRIPPRGGPWGSTFIDRDMISFILELFEWDSCPGEAKYGLLRAWEEVKRELFMTNHQQTSSPSKKGYGSIPIGSLLPFLNNELITRKCREYNIIHASSAGKIQKLVMYKHASASLLVSLDVIRTWFEKPINRICEEIAAIVSSFSGLGSKKKTQVMKKKNTIDFLFLVGGFSNCPLLKFAVNNIVNELNKMARRRVVGHVQIPNNPGQCVLNGAVIMGLYPNRISTRLSSKTYGIGIVTPWKDGAHPIEKRWVSPEGRAYTRQVFCTYVKKGDEVDVGYVVRKAVIPSRSDQTELSLTIFESDDRDVTFTSDPSVRKVQTILVTEPNCELPKHKRKILIEMKFGAEYIIVSARNMVTGENLNVKCRLHSSMI